MPESLASSFASRFGSRSSGAKEYKCTVQLLDDADTLQVDIKKSDNGQVIFDHVCSELDIVEKDYFGLRFMDSYKNRYWLDPNKPVLRQIKGSQPFVLRFRVKYYPSDPLILKEEITRYQLFLQLRRDLLHGRLYCPHNDAAYLGAYIIQLKNLPIPSRHSAGELSDEVYNLYLGQLAAEIGDYNTEEHKEGYVSEYKLFLKQTGKLEDKIAAVHKTLQGLTPAEAELNFLTRASQLDTYGYDPYTVKDGKLGQLYVGVTHQGILIYQGNRKAHHIKWDHLEKVDYLGKEFFVYPKPSYFKDDLSSMGLNLSINANTHALQTEVVDIEMDHSRNDGERTNETNDHSGDENENNGEKKKKAQSNPEVLKYLCPSASFCKHLWKFTLAQRGFFTEDKGVQVKQVTSKKRIPILSRGSTFRYAGRVLNEIKEEDVPNRNPPSFVRVHLEKQPSRNERGFPWMNKYSTLPRLGSKIRSEDTEMQNGKVKSKEAPEVRDLTLEYMEGLVETTGDLSPVYNGGMKSDPESMDFSLQASGPSNDSEGPVGNLGFASEPLFNSTPIKSTGSGRKGSESKTLTFASAQPVSQEEPKSEPKTSSSGTCGRIFQHILTGLLLSLIVLGVVVAVMEIKDRQFRGYVHSVPGMETFRHSYYEPGRSYVVQTYSSIMSAGQRTKKSKGQFSWFS